MNNSEPVTQEDIEMIKNSIESKEIGADTVFLQTLHLADAKKALISINPDNIEEIRQLILETHLLKGQEYSEGKLSREEAKESIEIILEASEKLQKLLIE